jgi:hypothetical protein
MTWKSHQGSQEGGGNFYLAAKSKRDELKARLDKKHQNFERSGGKVSEVPDRPGKMKEFTPERGAIDKELQYLWKLLLDILQAKERRDKLRKGLTAPAYTGELQDQDKVVAGVRPVFRKQKALMERMLRFLPESERQPYQTAIQATGFLLAWGDSSFPD